MNYFLISILGNFLPATLLLGLNWVERTPISPRRMACVSFLEAILGVALGRLLPTSPTILLYASLIQIVILILFLISQKNTSAWLGYFWQGILIATGAFHWGLDRNLSAISTTSIVNTDLLVNLSSVVAGVLILVVLAMHMTALCRQQRALRWPFLFILTAVLLVPLGGECALALIKLKAVHLTASYLSWTARSTDFATYLPYLLPALFFILIGLSIWKVMLPQRTACDVENPIERRKALGRYRYSRRLIVGSFIVLLLIVGSQGHWDCVASQPPRLSQTKRLNLGDDDQLHIPIATFKDNDLHRFDWVAEDGKVVRFFAINRYSDRDSVSVVFDSCMLCGDKGYALRDAQIVCIACGVRLFLPSVGNPGGCNPIPINGWKVTGEELVIPKASLEAGVNYFTTVVSRQVVDPVNGEMMISAKALRSYQFGGKTYYFTTEKSYETFISEPLKFIKKRKSCCGG